MLLCGYAKCVGRQKEPGVHVELGGATTGAARLGTIGAEPWEIVSASQACIFCDCHVMPWGPEPELLECREPARKTGYARSSVPCQ